MSKKFLDRILEAPSFEMFPGASDMARKAMQAQQERWEQHEKDAEFLEQLATEAGDDVRAPWLRRIAEKLREECD